jgi:outer membrane protein
MKTLAYAVALGLFLLPLAIATPAAAQGKIAVVDLQRAINETEDGRAAKDKLKKLFMRRQKDLDKKQVALKEMKESIEKQRNVLSRDAMQKKLEEYQKAFVDLQTVYIDYQRELSSKEAELTKDIIARMQQILRRIGQREGYTLVLERNEAGVIFVPSNLDLTDMLIQKYNAGEGREGRKSKSKGKGKNKKAKKK